MRVALITLGFTPFRTSGFDISGERLVRSLLERGHSVTVLAGENSPIDEIDKHHLLEIHRLPLGKSDWIGYALRIPGLLRTLGDFDVVHFWDVHFAYAFSGKYVATLHQSFHQRMEILDSSGDTTAHRSVMKLYYFLARWLAETKSLQRAAGLMAVSQATRDEFIHSYHISSVKIELTRHGIDTKLFYPYTNREMVRRELGLGCDEPVIMFAGFITPRKGLEYLAKAFPLIRPTPRLLLIGKWKNDFYRRQVLAKFGSYANRVLDLGYVPDNKLSQIYSASDIYVSASLVEGFGLPLGEALACKTPVVAFEVGSVAEVVGDGGVLVSPRDIIGLTNGISNLLQDPENRKVLAENGYQHIVSEFSVEKSIQSTLNAYKKFLG